MRLSVSHGPIKAASPRHQLELMRHTQAGLKAGFDEVKTAASAARGTRREFETRQAYIRAATDLDWAKRNVAELTAAYARAVTTNPAATLRNLNPLIGEAAADTATLLALVDR